MILLDGQTFLMLDEPYACIVHETCLNFFEWDGKPRCEPSENKAARTKQISKDEEIIGNYMSKAHWKSLRIPTAVREALVRFYFTGLTLRHNYTPSKKRGELIDRVAKALNLFGEDQAEAAVSAIEAAAEVKAESEKGEAPKVEEEAACDESPRATET